jgi:protein gp37
MSANTGIEWTDTTWNPIRGCSPVSAGCKNCYASKVAKRFSGHGQPYEGLVRINAAGERTDEWNGFVRPVEGHLLDPLKWGPIRLHEPRCGKTALGKQAACTCRAREERSRRIFVNSMSDLFHENLPDAEIVRIFGVAMLCQKHTFQVLTKRAARMQQLAADSFFVKRVHDWALAAARNLPASTFDISRLRTYQWPLPNIWLGVSVENRGTKHRMDSLSATPARVRFLSLEPLLEDPGEINLTGIHWVIVGGESGPGARPMHPDWARSLRDQCRAAGVPFFFKQWGEWLPEGVTKEPRLTTARHVWVSEDGQLHAGYSGVRDVRVWREGKKSAGALLDGREWKQFPEVGA